MAPRRGYSLTGGAHDAISRSRSRAHRLLVVSPMNRSDKLWRSLEQAADDPAFLEHATQEFPGLAAGLAEPLGRRQAIRLMAASIILSGLAGCDSKYGGNLIPAVIIPPNIIPALPNFYATAAVLDGCASR